jgi:hypothetical protein
MRLDLVAPKGHWLLVIHSLATFVMLGVILLVQLVHYPLMRFVEVGRFTEFEQLHREGIFWIVGPAMLIEGVTGMCLAITWKDDWRRFYAWLGLVLIGVNWLSTAFLQIPLHDSLQSNFLQSDLDRLVATNWIRTIAWSLRGAICFFLLISMGDNLGLWQPKRNANKS